MGNTTSSTPSNAHLCNWCSQLPASPCKTHCHLCGQIVLVGQFCRDLHPNNAQTPEGSYCWGCGTPAGAKICAKNGCTSWATSRYSCCSKRCAQSYVHNLAKDHMERHPMQCSYLGCNIPSIPGYTGCCPYHNKINKPFWIIINGVLTQSSLT